MEARIWNYSGWVGETNPGEIRNKYMGLLTESGFTVLGDIEHFFEPQGYTLLVLLGESHFAAHTFPEHGMTYIEISSCVEGPLNAFLAKMANVKNGY